MYYHYDHYYDRDKYDHLNTKIIEMDIDDMRSVYVHARIDEVTASAKRYMNDDTINKMKSNTQKKFRYICFLAYLEIGSAGITRKLL